MLTVHIYQYYRTAVLNVQVSSSTCDAHVRCTCAIHMRDVHIHYGQMYGQMYGIECVFYVILSVGC